MTKKTIKQIKRELANFARKWSSEDKIFDAAYYGRMGDLNHILQLGGDPNAVNQYGNTPLGEAIANYKTDAASLLLACGADPNKEDGNGWTPLALAVGKGCLEIVRLLIERGAYIDERALQCAYSGDHPKIASYFRQVMYNNGRNARLSPSPKRKPTRISRNTARLLQGWRKEPLSKEYIVDPDLD